MAATMRTMANAFAQVAALAHLLTEGRQGVCARRHQSSLHWNMRVCNAEVSLMHVDRPCLETLAPAAKHLTSSPLRRHRTALVVQLVVQPSLAHTEIGHAQENTTDTMHPPYIWRIAPGTAELTCLPACFSYGPCSTPAYFVWVYSLDTGIGLARFSRACPGYPHSLRLIGHLVRDSVPAAARARLPGAKHA